LASRAPGPFDLLEPLLTLAIDDRTLDIEGADVDGFRGELAPARRLRHPAIDSLAHVGKRRHVASTDRADLLQRRVHPLASLAASSSPRSATAP